MSTYDAVYGDMFGILMRDNEPPLRWKLDWDLEKARLEAATRRSQCEIDLNINDTSVDFIYTDNGWQPWKGNSLQAADYTTYMPFVVENRTRFSTLFEIETPSEMSVQKVTVPVNGSILLNLIYRSYYSNGLVVRAFSSDVPDQYLKPEDITLYKSTRELPKDQLRVKPPKVVMVEYKYTIGFEVFNPFKFDVPYQVADSECFIESKGVLKATSFSDVYVDVKQKPLSPKNIDLILSLKDMLVSATILPEQQSMVRSDRHFIKPLHRATIDFDILIRCLVEQTGIFNRKRKTEQWQWISWAINAEERGNKELSELIWDVYLDKYYTD